jgi:predicted enzyme related to lactoylglutathione lyase
MATSSPKTRKRVTKEKNQVSYEGKAAAQKPKRETLGWVTHTDIISEDPVATQKWAEKVLGWKFAPPLEMEEGIYRMFHYSEMGGGGIQKNMEGQAPSTTPFIHVKDCQAAFDKAIEAGAKAGHHPKQMGPVVIATVTAPGGVVIGLSSDVEDAGS